MKNSIFIASVLGLALASCQSDDIEPAVVSQGDGNVIFHLSAPESTSTLTECSIHPAIFNNTNIL